MNTDKPIAKSRARPALIILLLVAIAALAASYFLTPTPPPIDGVVARRSISPRKPRDIIVQEGQLRLIHDGSIYTFKKDGAFKGEPAGMSGESIKGTWTEKSDGVYDIDGKWEGINREFLDNDFRVMTLTIQTITGKATLDWRKEDFYTGDLQAGKARKKPAP